MAQIGEQLIVRQRNIKRAVHNFRLIADALGDRNTQLSQFVGSSSEVFSVFAAQQADLRAALRLLPSALASTNAALASSQTLTSSLGPTLQALLPAANGLKDAQTSLQSLAADTTPVIENQLRPFVPKAAPTVTALRPAARDLATATPRLGQAVTVVNKLLNGLAYNPTGKNADGTPKEGFLFWLAWANHATASMFASQDAMGPIRRGIVFGNCTTLQTLEVVGTANPVLGTISSLLNPPTSAEACPTGGQ
jgi:phospholipid/cholesterol/gamma-HCH transport system substrate-binding protein